MKEATKLWFDKAREDIEAIEVLIEKSHLANIIVFHAQQAVEKCFKAVIEEFKIGYIKTHDIISLHEIIKSRLDSEFNIEKIKKLNEVYTDSRYPTLAGSLPNGAPVMQDAREFYMFAKEVYDKIYSSLKKI